MDPRSNREQRILAVANFYLGGLRGDPDPSPGEVRDTYLRAAGYDALANADTRTVAEIDLGDESSVTITIRVRDRLTLNKLAKIVRLPFVARTQSGVLRMHAGGATGDDSESWDALARAKLREPRSAGSRKDRLTGQVAATVLAVFYLSRPGGGTRTTDDAIDLLAERIEAPALEECMEGWPGSYHRVLRTLRMRYGPLATTDE